MSEDAFGGIGENPLSRAMAWAYGVGQRTHTAYRERHQETVDVPVISIGNVVVGGTGKTPLTAAIARRLCQNGTVAILSRGYGGKERGPVRVLEDSDPVVAGDEPVELAQAVPSADVWVARNRVLGAREAATEGAEFIILDDGFSYRGLARDVDLLVFDERGVGNGLLLPAGPLRESAEAIQRADAVLLRGKAEPPPGWTGPVFRFDVRRARFVSLWGEPVKKPGEAIAAAGIAWPGRFFAGLREQRIRLQGAYGLPDHAAWRLNAIRDLEKNAAGKPIIITAKDAVKVRRHYPEGNWVVAQVTAEVERSFWPWLWERIR